MSDSDRDEAPDDQDGWRFDPDSDEVDRDPPEDVDDDGWRFSLDEVSEDGVIEDGIEPGQVTLENALFVLLGALAMVLVFVRLWMVLG